MISPAPAPAPNDRILALHGARGVAMLAVLAYHIYTGAVAADLSPDLVGLPRMLANGFGKSIVGMFLLISGYVTPVCVLKYGVGRFVVSRGIRLYPTFLVPHLLIFSIGPLIGYKWFAGITPVEYVLHFFSNLLFLPGLFDLPIAQIVAWTISYDAALYLLAAATLGVSQMKWKGARVAGWLVLAACVGTLLVLRPMCWFMALGVAVYVVRQRAPALFCGTWLTGIAGPLALLAMGVGYSFSIWLALPMSVFALAALVADQGWPARLLQRRFLQYFGDVSYSFYLWHSMVIFGTRRICAAFLPETWPVLVNVAIFGAVTLVLSLITSHISYRVCEVAISGALARRFVPRRKEGTAVKEDSSPHVQGVAGRIAEHPPAGGLSYERAA